MSGMLPRQETRSRGSTNGTARVKLGELHSVCRQRINTRRLEIRLPHAAEIVVAKIIGNDPDDVWLLQIAGDAGISTSKTSSH